MNRQGSPFRLQPGMQAVAMGLGRFGGQVAAIRFLAERGVRVRVTDQADPATLTASIAELDHLPQVSFQWGPHREDDFRNVDLVLVSPAVPPRQACLQIAAAHSVPIITEIELLLQHAAGRKVAVSGTVGKSTTTTMIAHLLERSGRRVHVGGNLGGSLLPCLREIQAEDWLVLELSSFQLHWLQTLRPRFEVTVLTNFEPHHLEWHGGVSEYRRCKQILLAGQTAEDWAILPADWQFAERADWSVPAQIRWFSGVEPVGQAVLPTDWPEHWKTNGAAALAVGEALGIPQAAGATWLTSYAGLPHRLEELPVWEGIRWINDSKATTPWATTAALRSLREPFWLILGGATTTDEAASLLHEITHAPLLRGVCGMGPAGAEWLPRIAAASPPALNRPATYRQIQERTVEIAQRTTLRESVEWCRQRAQVGDTILLSPGCPSFNEFLHFEQRGELFTALARGERGCLPIH